MADPRTAPADPTSPAPVLRADYRAPDYTIEQVALEFELGLDVTVVEARLAVRRRDGAAADAPLVLDGEALELLHLAIDGVALASDAYTRTDETLTIPQVPARFELHTRVQVEPRKNTALSGLYVSGETLVTQCEAQGFRRITYFIDRPDVMATYSVTLIADAAQFPVLLSNGNRVSEGDGGRGRTVVRWHDPHPKPSYLFALVAGRLDCLTGSFRTQSGRDVRLEIWSAPGRSDACAHALRSLQSAMAWDERRFGLEYDLDLYMIVAVDDFNAGAMENKGLNIFNAKYVLARPETATDDDFEGVESVIAHEYFHNWTGNRVTLRDWFQLTLKEGLTVYRDQEYTADTASRAVKRISDVNGLRTVQFAEDQGPMAHPVRPDQYIEMNNFYTATVYEKGAEVIRMLEVLLGRDGFRAGMDLYFARHDGQAVTCEDFVAAMASASGRDLGQFLRWYGQAGTPTLAVATAADPSTGSLAVTLRQRLPEAHGGDAAAPLHIPVAVGVLAPDGTSVPVGVAGTRAPADGEPAHTAVLELREREQTFTLTGVPQGAVLSLLRGFSAPVRLEVARDNDELAFLFAHDPDPLSRWDAGQALAQEVILGIAAQLASDPAATPATDPRMVAAFGAVLADAQIDGSFKAMALTLPGERVLAQAVEQVDPDALHAAREAVATTLARAYAEPLRATEAAARPDGEYAPTVAQIAGRRLANTCLAYLARLGDPAVTEALRRRVLDGGNMTDVQAALTCLAPLPGAARDEALAAFHRRFAHDPLVLDKWFAVQAAAPGPDAFERLVALCDHPDFTLSNPNRVYALLGSFAHRNPTGFHRRDGAAHAFVADKVLELDARNPQVASRIVGAFTGWRRMDAPRAASLHTQLERMAGSGRLSKNVFEKVSRALAPA
jgi:aminopeptidase N